MLLAATEYVRPDSLEEAVAALAATPGSRVLAGGQTLLNVLKHRAASVELLVDISRLAELRFIDVRPDGSVTIGAATTYGELERSAELRAAHPLVAEIAAGTVDRQVRARGTIGGNACFADPASNYPPLLVALGATMRIAGPGGKRDVPAAEFFVGMWSTAVGDGELLKSITLPSLGGAGVGFRSLQLAADSWALARAAAWVRSGSERVEEVRVVLGCVAATPARASATERKLAGGPATAEAIEAAAALAGEGLDPPSDNHATGAYRREMAVVMARRALVDAVALGGGSR